MQIVGWNEMFARTILLLAVSTLAASCGATNQEPIPPVKQQEQANVSGIGSDKAIALANEAAVKSYPSLQKFRPVVCEQQIFWRVIYDGGGPEILIDKISGKIVWSQTIPQGPEAPKAEAKTPNKITAANAVDIVQADMKRSLPDADSAFYVLHTCELDRVWRVIVEPKLTIKANEQYPAIPNASTLNYVIDKSSGEILFKQRA